MGATHLVLLHDATHDQDDVAPLAAAGSPPAALPLPLRPSSLVLASELVKLAVCACAVGYLLLTERDAAARQTLLRQLHTGTHYRRRSGRHCTPATAAADAPRPVRAPQPRMATARFVLLFPLSFTLSRTTSASQ